MLRHVSNATLSSVPTLCLFLLAAASVIASPTLDDGGEEARLSAEEAALAPEVPQEILDAISAKAAVAPEHLAINQQEMTAIARGELEVGPPPSAERPAAPMMVEIQDQLQDTRAALSELHTRYVEALVAGDSAKMFALDREIASVERDNEASLLRIQLRFASEGGRAEEVQEIRSALQAIEALENAKDAVAPSNPLPPAERARSEEAGR